MKNKSTKRTKKSKELPEIWIEQWRRRKLRFFVDEDPWLEERERYRERRWDPRQGERDQFIFIRKREMK